MLAPAFALSILLAYAAALWWLLRREAAWTYVALAALTSIALALRLVYTRDFPAGLNEDEVKILWCTIPLLRHGAFFAEDCTGLPALLSILFEAQLAEWIGPSRWAIRSYSLLGGVLAVPAAFAAARSLGLRVAPSLAAAAFLATMPWAIFYGRVHQSGEMLLHEMLVVAVLARFVRGQGGLPEVTIAALGLCLLFYGYFSGRVLLGLTMVAAVLARGRYRALCLAVVLLAMAGWAPYVLWSRSPHVWVGLSARQTQAEYDERPLATLARKTEQALHAFVAPVAYDQWLTVRAGAMHPWLVLGLAAIGSLTGVRRGLFLWAGFLGGLAPAILGYSPYPSTRRMLMAFPFVSLAAACALDLLPRARLRQAVCAAVAIVAGVQGVRFYFSDGFWMPGSLWVFDAERTALVEALPTPPHPRLIISPKLGYYFAPRANYDKSFESLSPDTLFPPDGEAVLYAFDPAYAPLQSLYVDLFGVDRVESFGGAFLVRLEARDWSWLRRHGWRYRWTCEGKPDRATDVPVLFQAGFGYRDTGCEATAIHTWRARWQGPPAHLRVRFNGTAEVQVGEQPARRHTGWQDVIDFDVRTGDQLRVRVEVPHGLEMLATLLEVLPTGERVPLLEWLAPSVETAGD